MALNKAQLQADLITAFSDPKTTNNVAAVAEALAAAIDNYVKTANATGTDSHGDSHNLSIS